MNWLAVFLWVALCFDVVVWLYVLHLELNAWQRRKNRPIRALMPNAPTRPPYHPASCPRP
jgi:hypothetical protein